MYTFLTKMYNVLEPQVKTRTRQWNSGFRTLGPVCQAGSVTTIAVTTSSGSVFYLYKYISA